MAKKDQIKELVEKIWPKTKKELEKAIKNAKDMLAKGEKQLKNLSGKGVERAVKISLGIRKEKLYYELGKSAAGTTVSKWQSSRKINSMLKEIKELDRQIKKK